MFKCFYIYYVQLSLLMGSYAIFRILLGHLWYGSWIVFSCNLLLYSYPN